MTFPLGSLASHEVSNSWLLTAKLLPFHDSSFCNAFPAKVLCRTKKTCVSGLKKWRNKTFRNPFLCWDVYMCCRIHVIQWEFLVFIGTTQKTSKKTEHTLESLTSAIHRTRLQANPLVLCKSSYDSWSWNVSGIFLEKDFLILNPTTMFWEFVSGGKLGRHEICKDSFLPI